MDEPSAVNIQLPNSEQFHLANGQGQEYLIQISWPLEWQNRHDFAGEIPILYIVDGNALFLTATETAWRRATSSQYSGGGIIVAIGYPSLHGKLYDMQRRSYDLTPPQPTNAIAGHGGADAFLAFIESAVKPAVESRFPHAKIAREALYGHSYGGLFALHALFTKPELFDCYLASSPSVWWNDRFIEREATNFIAQKERKEVENMSRPSLMVFWGSLEQDAPLRNGHESKDDYEARRKVWLDLRMVDNAREICERLKGCERLQTVLGHEFEGEEHTSVMACSVSRGLTMFFEAWPL